MDFQKRCGYSDTEYDVVRFRSECAKHDTGFLKNTYEQIVYELAGGDVTKFEAVKNIKVGEASVIILIKEINAFKEWFAGDVIKEGN